MTALPPIKWTASPNYSSRGGQKVRLIVAHDCEGSYAGSISWFAMQKSQVSAHLVLREDGGEATQMVAWSNKAWHACNFNPFSEGIEAAGFEAKGLGAPEFDSLAALVAWRLQANEIPCQEATPANKWTGFTMHAKLGAAGGGHHDFSESAAVWADFIKRVIAAYSQSAPQPAPAPAAPPGFIPNPSLRIDDADLFSELKKLGFDSYTFEGAVKAFQTKHHLIVDGICGPETRKQIALSLQGL
jgi:hypothetical protein